jgi:hypothetical protein
MQGARNVGMVNEVGIVHTQEAELLQGNSMSPRNGLKNFTV